MFILTDKKQCYQCGEWKDRGEFNKNKSRKDGLSSECRECHKERGKKYYQENSDTVKEKHLNWAQRNIEKVRAVAREYGLRYYREHREQSLMNWHKRRARKRNGDGKITAGEWRDLCERYGNKCLCCGRTDVKLTMDHVLPLALGGTNTIDNIQPLCSLCNMSKHAKHIDYRGGVL